MFSKISTTWSLMGDSWQLLKKDKELLLFPLVSGICCLLVLASFAIPIVSAQAYHPPGQDATTAQQVTYYLTLFLFYFCNYYVISFFNVAIIACATIRLQGGDPTIADGFKAALSRMHLIFGWALISATVGLILRIIEERSESVGRFVAGLLGMAWTAVSFLVIPAMVVENKSPLASLRQSTKLLRQTWGEQLVSNFSFGLVFFLLAIPAFLLAGLGIFLLTGDNTVPAAICIILAILYAVILSLVQSTLLCIFQATLYFYARDNQLPPAAAFAANSLSDAFTVRD